MLVVDASSLYEVVVSGPSAEPVRERFAADTDLVAPHLIDVEVMGVLRRALLRRDLDQTAADQALDDLTTWPGERLPHRPLLARAWELRQNLRPSDAMYVALAEAFDAPLLTLDGRLAGATGPRCRIELVET